MKDVVLPVLFRVSRLEGGLEYSTKKFEAGLWLDTTVTSVDVFNSTELR